MLLKQFEGLVALFEAGSFPDASKSLDVPLATLRTRIRLLEKEFGVDIVRRSGRGIELTEIGWQILPYAQRLVDLARQAGDILAHPADSRLSVGCVALAGPCITATVLKLLDQPSPDVRVVLLHGDGACVREMLVDGRVRLGLIDGEYNRSRFRSLWTHREPIDGFTRRLPPDAQPEWNRLPVVVPANEPALEQAAARVGGACIWHVDSLTMAKEIAQSGHAVAVLPVRAADAELASGTLQRMRVPGLSPVKLHCLAVLPSEPTTEERRFLKVLASIV